MLIDLCSEANGDKAMASVFRRRISKQIVSTFKTLLTEPEHIHLYKNIPIAVKFNQPKLLPPQFELGWKDVLNINPGLKSRVHFNTVLTYLKNQVFPTPDGITNVFVDPVNPEKVIFTIDQEIFTSSVILDINARIEHFPENSCFFKGIPPENVIVEYSSPNMAKPFHFGHFRSTIMGNFISNICEYVGHDVKRINYIGDWGLQYGILALGFHKFGDTEKFQKDPLNHLFEVYKEANKRNDNDPSFNEEAKAYFKKMEQGDSEVLSLWENLRNLSLKEMDATYKRLNITFDETHGESMYAKDVQNIYESVLSKNLASLLEDGSIEVHSAETENEDKTILRKKDGTSLYITRDLAAAISRKKKFNFDSMFYVVDSSQRKHFMHLKNILNSMGYSWASDLKHVPFGRILKSSTRKGTAVFLSDILDEAKDRTLESMQNSPTTKVTENLDEVAEILGVASLIIGDFRVRRKRDYPFDWDKILSSKGDSGNSLQYTHARLNSIKENCGVDLYLNCEFACLAELEAVSLIAHLSKFDEIIYQTYIDLEPCVLVHYLFQLRNEVNRAVKVLNVKGSSLYLARARLLLFHTAYLVMRKSLKLLGITPLNKM